VLGKHERIIVWKHSGKIKAVKIKAVFNSILAQLAKENKGVDKFIFKEVLPNALGIPLLKSLFNS